MKIRRTRGPVAFCAELQRALDGLNSGRVNGMSAHYDPTGIGRVSVTTVDGQDVDIDDLPALDTSDEDDDLVRRSKAETSPGSRGRK